MRQSRFLTEMRNLLSDNAVSLNEITQELRSKGLVFLALLSVLPFMQPIPIPGLSSLLGFIILLQGIGLIIFDRPILTKKMRELQLPPDKVRSFVQVAEKIYPYIGWLVRARGQEVAKHRITQIVAGLCIVFLAAFLSLPLPIPSSNFLPAIGIFSICLGILEEDVLLIALGIAYSALFAWMLSFFAHFIAAELSGSDWWANILGD